MLLSLHYAESIMWAPTVTATSPRVGHAVSPPRNLWLTFVPV